MDAARKIFVGLAWLFVLAVAIQFFLAGLGVLGGESLEAHRQWGFIVLHLLPILMIVAAIVGRMGRTVIGLTVLLLLLVFVQVDRNRYLYPLNTHRHLRGAGLGRVYLDDDLPRRASQPQHLALVRLKDEPGARAGL